MSDVGTETKHDRATCPSCGERAVRLLTAPMKPPKMDCQICGWDSLEGSA